MHHLRAITRSLFVCLPALLAVFFAASASAAIPTVTGLSPSSATAGGAAFSLTITGAGFGSASTTFVSWHTSTGATPLTATSVTSTKIAVTVPAGSAWITVFTTIAGGGTSVLSSASSFTVNAPPPVPATIAGLSPSSATAGGAAFTLTITGAHFTPSTSAKWITSASATLLQVKTQTATQLTVTIAASLIASADTASVVVSNPGTVTGAGLAFPIVAPPPNGAKNASLLGRYVCKLEGYFDNDGSHWAALASFVADGSDTNTLGKLTAGTFDENGTDLPSALSGTITGTYSIGADYNGIATLTGTPSGGSPTSTQWALAMAQSTVPAQQFRLVESDDAGAHPSGQHGTGNCYLATTGAFTASTISGSGFAVLMSGENTAGGSSPTAPKAGAGRFSASNGNITAGILDIAKGGSPSPQEIAFTGAYTAPNATSGRLTLALGIGGGHTINLAEYIIDARRMFILETTTADGAFAGDVRKQMESSYSAANVKGSLVVYIHGVAYSGGSLSAAKAQVEQGSSTGSGSLTINESYQDNAGTYSSGQGNGTVALTFVSAYPGRVTFNPGQGGGYLYLFDTNSAFELNYDGQDGFESGWAEPQSATTFSDAALAGNYMAGSNFQPMEASLNAAAGVWNIAASGALASQTSTAGQGNFTYDSPAALTYTWNSTTYGAFQVSHSTFGAYTCAVISSVKFACITQTNPGADLLTMQK